MHNDEPALLDTLERGALIEEVGKAIAHCTPPQVFGIHGDWGLGKTSFLHQVQWYLTGDCPQQPKTVTDEMMEKQTKDVADGAPSQQCGVYKDVVQAVWFDAWRYQHEAAPVVALLHEMRTQLSWGNRVTRATRRKAAVAFRGALLSMDDLTRKIGLQYSKFRQANREWETENLAAALPSHTLREHLSAAVAQLLPGKPKNKRELPPPKLVVFIDDIDRCEPEAAYRLLEGLKIYLTLDNCVFVLGMNQKAIEEAVAKQLRAGSGDDPTMRAAAYMEKLCQNVWRLPAVRRPEQLLCDLLASTVDNSAVRNCIKRAVEEPAHSCLASNPRRIKGLANLIGRLAPRLPRTRRRPPARTGARPAARRRIPRAPMPSQEGGPDDPQAIIEAQLLVIVACIHQFHPDLYVRWAADSALYDKIRIWCEAVETRDDGTTKPSEESPLPFLQSLTLPLQPATPTPTDPAPTDPAPEYYESTFPDPTQANVFWIQSMILHLGRQVASDRFERYLHGVPA